MMIGLVRWSIVATPRARRVTYGRFERAYVLTGDMALDRIGAGCASGWLDGEPPPGGRQVGRRIPIGRGFGPVTPVGRESWFKRLIDRGRRFLRRVGLERPA